MVMKMLRGRMRKSCGKHTYNFLQILKKNECTFVLKKMKTPFWKLEFLEPQLRDFLVQPICEFRRKESCWLELLRESLSCIIIKNFDVMFL